MFGTVDRVNFERGFGFIAPDDRGEDVFFHVKALEGLPFDASLEQRRVEFAASDSDRGPRASFVRPVGA
jgi:CspA family cold shock protein